MPGRWPALHVVTPSVRDDSAWKSELLDWTGIASLELVCIDNSECRHDSAEMRVLPELPGSDASGKNDLAARRRYGIARAAHAGARYVLLLDDDVALPEPEDIDWGLAVLRAGAEAAAYTVSDYPDNSSVFHAWRAGGWEPGVQPGCGAVMLSVQASLREAWRWVSVYNEDHLFLDGLRVTGGGPHVTQAEYDPWEPGRARAQEAGEMISEGLVLGDGTDPRFWTWQLERRRVFLGYVSGLRLPGEARRAVGEAIEVNAELLADWMRAWRNRERMHERLRHREGRGRELSGTLRKDVAWDSTGSTVRLQPSTERYRMTSR